MPLNPSKVGLAVQQNVSIVCATCEHFWRAQDQKRPTCGKDCGGPVGGRAFPEYKGPISDLSRWCFVCGDGTKHVVRHPSRTLGVCAKHQPMVAAWCEQFQLPLLTVGSVVSRKKTLFEAIHEVELYYAQKEERDL